MKHAWEDCLTDVDRIVIEKGHYGQPRGFGKKPLLIVFSAVFGIGCAVIGFAPILSIYIIGACFTGVGYSVCESLSSAALSDLGEAEGMRYINLSQSLLSVSPSNSSSTGVRAACTASPSAYLPIPTPSAIQSTTGPRRPCHAGFFFRASNIFNILLSVKIFLYCQLISCGVQKHRRSGSREGCFRKIQ